MNRGEKRALPGRSSPETERDWQPQQQPAGIDRAPQLLRLLTLLAHFGIDPTAPPLLTHRCAASP